MSRITERKKDRYGNEYIATCGGAYFEEESVYKALEKLAHYEDLEEQSRLIVQKHGKWIPFELDTRGHIEIIHYECSSCHEISDDATMYCPNCGAKMDEVE